MSLFPELFSKTDDYRRTGKLPTSLNTYHTVHKDDQLAVNIIMPDSKDGPWIAGGACLRWFQNRPLGSFADIDVFCKDEHQAKQLIKKLQSLPYQVSASIIETNNAHTFSIADSGKQWKIQVITCKYFECMEDVINSFDISVCQVATAGHEWILGENTVRDINERKLRFRHFTPQAPKRLIKYWTYGFTPVPGTLEDINNNKSIWDFAGSEDYDNSL